MWSFVLLLIYATFHFVGAEVRSEDPDVGLDMMEIVQERGYVLEKHSVTTEDGYILGVFRIPCSKRCTIEDSPKPVVFLQHGLLDSSYTWVNNYEHQSLAYILADANYDVWMGNSRGNTYSRSHVSLVPEEDEFWFFSWDEMAIFDLPAMLQYALDVTGAPTLAYIGHSQGTIQGFSGFSLASNAAISEHVALFVALAPVAYVGHVLSPALQTLAQNDVATKLQNMGVQEFLPADSKLEDWAPTFCRLAPHLCETVLGGICGPSVSINATRLQVYVSETPAGTSTQNMIHWTQGVVTNTFQMFDYGSNESNMAVYGVSSPPPYDLSAIRVPTAIFYGANDYLADEEDVHRLIREMNDVVIVYERNQSVYAHLDFTWGFNAHTLVYHEVITLLEEYLG